MPRLTRKNIKVFAGSATNNGVFGSLQANNPTTTSDVEQLQSLSAWSEGWNAATETSEELPPLEEIQGVEYVTTYQQAYIMQEGIPEWSATVTYYKGCLTKEVTSTGFKIYNSLTDNNTGNLLSDTSNWKKVMDSDDLYAFDNAVVHKTGDETIGGRKTYTESYVQKNSDLTKGTLPASANWWSNEYTDKNGSGLNNRLACIEYVILPNGDAYTNLRTYKYASNNSDNATLSIVYPKKGNPFATAPTPTTITSTDSEQIATTGWVNKVGNNVVHKTGDETITGTKTFTGDGWITKIQNTDVTYNIAPSSNKGASIVFADKNGTQMGCVESMRNPSNDTLVRFNVYSPNGNWASQALELMIDANDNVSAFAPTPHVSSNGTNIATTAYVKNVLSALYPVGSIYIGTQSTCPLASLISGSQWQLVAQDRALWGGNGSNGNSTINAGLPNITGSFGSGCLINWQDSQYWGALYRGSQGASPQNAGGTDGGTNATIAFNAASSNSIYGSSSTVQPPAYRVNVWRRTA